jgi:hypothetical protein
MNLRPHSDYTLRVISLLFTFFDIPYSNSCLLFVVGREMSLSTLPHSSTLCTSQVVWLSQLYLPTDVSIPSNGQYEQQMARVLYFFHTKVPLFYIFLKMNLYFVKEWESMRTYRSGRYSAMLSRPWLLMDVWSPSCSSHFTLEKGHSVLTGQGSG